MGSRDAEFKLRFATSVKWFTYCLTDLSVIMAKYIVFKPNPEFV